MKHDAIDDVMRVVAEHFGVSVADIRSQRRSRDIHTARVWAAYLAVMMTDEVYETIGERFSRVPTVVRMYTRACARLVASDHQSAAMIDALRSQVRTRLVQREAQGSLERTGIGEP